MAAMWAVVPAKPLRTAKQRLAGVLSEKERRSLAGAMLSDVLRCLRGVEAVEGIVVVSSDPEVAKLAAARGARIAADENTGHTAAVECGIRALRAEGIAAALVLSADVPGVASGEIERLLLEHDRAAARGPAVTIVSDRRGDGTNAICCSPSDAIPFAFGLGSLQRHLDAARASGVAACVLEMRGIALDIDEPSDLEMLLATDAPCATVRYLRDTVRAGSA
jgi:2-phospho-L-lactate guanylyltransferase